MKTYTIGFKEIIIAVLLLLSGYLYFFDRNDVKTETITETITIPGDTIYEIVAGIGPPNLTIIGVPDINIINKITDTIFKDTGGIVDSLEIFKRFFTMYYRSDTIIQNECSVIIQDTITQNKIIYENILIKNMREKSIITNTTNINTLKRKFLVGGFTTITPGENLGIGPMVAIQVKKDHVYLYGYDIINQTHNIGAVFKINFKSK
jgi:hypothetical protein